MRRYASSLVLGIGLTALATAMSQAARAQSFGIELHNTLTPAAGAMGGTSIARPQDLAAALQGNPATVAQFEGTQVLFAGAWNEATYRIAHRGGILPGLGAFNARSEAEGSALGGFTVTQDLRALGIPGTVGIGLAATAGAGLSFRDVPASNGTTVALSVLQITNAVGVDVTDRLAVGASLMFGTGGLDAPFTGAAGYAYDYALRGNVGVTYDLGGGTDLGLYYQTKQSFNFDDAIRLETFDGTFLAAEDVDADLPDNLGLGIANRCLMDGQLLLAADVLFKQWDNADLFRALYQNQWVFQVGAQYRWSPRVRLRLGYVYAENPIQPNPGNSAGGVVPPGGQAALEYVQSLLAVTNLHRLSGGVGIRDVLPGVDFDLLAGGMFESFEQLGSLSAASVESYWVGAGITWRFGRGACRRLPVADDWAVN